MEPNELMFDDYITVNHACKQPTIERVYRVGCIGINVKSGNQVNFVYYNRVSPVPLLDEFLEKNGFKKKRNIYNIPQFCYTENDKHYCSCIIEPCANGDYFVHVDRGYPGEFSGHIRYVHELQHIFRMLNIEKEVIL